MIIIPKTYRPGITANLLDFSGWDDERFLGKGSHKTMLHKRLSPIMNSDFVLVLSMALACHLHLVDNCLQKEVILHPHDSSCNGGS